MKPDMRVRLAGMELVNPVIAASGTFGYGIEFEEIVSLESIGGFVTKGISLNPMAGHAAPRIVQTAAGMLNAIGLQNVGVEEFIARKLPPLQRYPQCKAIVNVFGYTVAEYLQVIERLKSRPVLIVEEDQVTVGNMIEFLGRRMSMEDRPVSLSRLLGNARSPRALVAMFLALLELVRLQAIQLRQDKLFSEIFIKKHTEFETVINEAARRAQDDWR